MKTKVTLSQIGNARQSMQGAKLVTHVPLQIKKRGARKVLIAPPTASAETTTAPEHADAPLLVALGRAFYWQRLIDEGHYADADDLAQRQRLDRTVVKETLRFTMLAPDIVQAVLNGRQRMLTLQELRRQVPPEWATQRQRWGFPPGPVSAT